jgi:Ca-activated chloride channel family protein
MVAWKGRLSIALLVAAAAWPAAEAVAQVHHLHVRAFSSHVIVPQSRSIVLDRSPRVEVTGVKVGVVILEQAATTSMDIALKNPSNRRIEAELLVPVPEGAAIRGFDFQGAGKEPSAELLPKAAALETYRAIVAKVKDPALLEFAGCNLVRSSVFPIEPNGTQAVRLTYEHLLPADGQRVDYVLPRTESIEYKVPWEVSVKIKSKRPISTVYSPSHQIETQRADKNTVSVKISGEAMREPGPVQLAYLQESGEEVTASLLAYPDPKTGGGYFLLLAGLPAKMPRGDDGRPAVKREVTIVLDRSGSMEGEKIKQAKAAALQVVEGLEDGEAFNVIDYSDSIASFAPSPVVKNKKNVEEARHYIRRLVAAGGTNLHDSLIEALRPRPAEGMLPLLLYLTDGLPTVGVRDEVAIRNTAVQANQYKRRIFTFGVGYDVNAPLLSHLAEKSRATSTFVLPNEEIEAKVSQVYRRLFGPVLAEPELRAVDAQGEPTTRRVADLLPATLPDLFEGDQLVLLGRYTGQEPLHFRLKGAFHDKPRTFKFDFQLDKATAKNGFVPRLWASRKIAMLVDEIRQSGAGPSRPSVLSNVKPADPRMKELVDEIVRLSTEFGVLTEYTAFLAREGTDLSRRDAVLREANQNFYARAQQTRSGIGAVNQAFNYNVQRAQVSQNRRNEFLDQNMNRVQTTRVQQMNDRGFFQQGNRWIDGSVINARREAQPDRTVTIGSPEFMEIVDRLVRDNRQGVLSMSGEIVVNIDGRTVLITTP